MIEICEIAGETVKASEGINQADPEMNKIEEVEVVSSQLSQAVQQEPCTQHSDTMKQLKLLFVTMIMLLVMCATVCKKKESDERNLVVDSDISLKK